MRLNASEVLSITTNWTLKKRVAVLYRSIVLGFLRPKFIVDRKRYCVEREGSDSHRPQKTIARDCSTLFSFGLSQVPITCPALTADVKHTFPQPEHGGRTF